LRITYRGRTYLITTEAELLALIEQLKSGRAA
jgi:hypothetical protein